MIYYESRTNCILLLTLDQCAQGDIFYFGGLLIPTTGSASVFCNDTLTLTLPSAWDQALVNASSTGQYSSECPSLYSEFATVIIGASASIKFNGSGVSVFGKVNQGYYVIVFPSIQLLQIQVSDCLACWPIPPSPKQTLDGNSSFNQILFYGGWRIPDDECN
jgi:hypothetical protein